MLYELSWLTGLSDNKMLDKTASPVSLVIFYKGGLLSCIAFLKNLERITFLLLLEDC